MKSVSRWQAAPTTPALSDGEVHIWRTGLVPTQPIIERLEQTLAQDELARARRFRFEKDRRRFVVARGVLRSILGRYLNTEPRALTFAYNAHGKPLLAACAPEALCFNLSHSGEQGLFAITRSKRVGIDLEQVRTDYPFAQVAARVFSPHEKEMFRVVPEPMQAVAFFNGWTRKEAFIKAVGEGISFPLAEFDVSLAPEQPARILAIKGDAQAAREWQLQVIDVGPDYTAACAVEGQACRFSYWDWSVMMTGT